MPDGRGDVTVRLARVDDAAEISRVHVTSWQQAYRDVIPVPYLQSLHWRDRVDFWRQQIDQPPAGSFTLVAEASKGIVGFLGAGPARDDDLRGHMCYEVYAIYLLEEAWGRGVGSALMQAALSRLPGGVSAVTLWVLGDNERACRFYERHGFAPDGAIKPIIRGGHRLLERRYRREIKTTSSGWKA